MAFHSALRKDKRTHRRMRRSPPKPYIGSNQTVKQWPTLLAIALLAVLVIAGSDARQNELWSRLTPVLEGGGPDAEEVLMLLGTIDDETARQLLRTTLEGKSGLTISYAAKGLTLAQCLMYLPDLRNAALDPSVEPKPAILAAIARAGNAKAAEILGAVADAADQPAAGVAFGLLEQMGAVARQPLQREVADGRSAWARETAVSILRRMRTRDALPAFRTALQDGDENVGIAGALGLAQWGIADGEKTLEAAAKRVGDDYQVEALVALATLDRPQALRALRSFVTGPDEILKGRVVWAIARSGDPKLKAFAYQLRLEQKPEFLAMLAEKLLDTRDPRDLSVLEAALTGGDQMCELIAAQRLLGTGLRGTAETVIARELGSDNEPARSLAIKLASEDSGLWPTLASRVNDAEAGVKVAAMIAVMNLRETERFDEVQQNLESDSRAVSLTAARVLVSLDPNAARTVFEKHAISTLSYVKIYSSAMLLALAQRGLAAPVR